MLCCTTKFNDEEFAALTNADLQRCRDVLSDLQHTGLIVHKEIESAPLEGRETLLLSTLGRVRALDEQLERMLRACLQDDLVSPGAEVRELVDEHQHVRQQLKQLIDMCKPYLKETTSGRPADFGATLSAQVLNLHAKLEDLSSALNAWVEVRERLFLSSSRVSMSATDPVVHSVEVASAFFEDLHVSLGATSGNIPMQAASLVRALPLTSAWRDHAKLQDLLKTRHLFLHTRFDCGRRFIQASSDKNRWPEADVLARQWTETLQALFGTSGSQWWRCRARSLGREGDEQTGSLNNTDVPFSHRPSSLANSGVMRIRNIRTTNVDKVSRNSSPYVVFEFAGQSAATSAAYGSESSPQWTDEEIVFQVEALRQNPILRISLWNWDGINGVGPVGRVDEQKGGLDIMPLLHCNYPALVPANPGGIHDKQQFLARCQACRLPMRLGAVLGVFSESFITFDLLYSDGGTADPLTFWGPEEVMTLHLLAEVEIRMAQHRNAFAEDSEGFFLRSPDADVKRFPPKMPSRGDHPKCYGDEMETVLRYNRVLDEISEIVSTSVWAANHGTGARKAATMTNESVFTRLEELRTEAQKIERQAFKSPDLWRVIAEQDKILPSIGAWSTDRRRQLRDSVFQAMIRLRCADVFGVPVWVWKPLILVLMVCAAVLACLVKVLASNGDVGRAALPALVIVAICALSPFCSPSPGPPDLPWPEQWHFRFLCNNGKYDYCSLALCDDCEP